LAGEAIDEREAEGGRISDETLLVLLNAYHEDLTFTLPEAGGSEAGGSEAGGPEAGGEGRCVWELLLNTTQPDPPAPSGEKHTVGSGYALATRALALFRRVSS
jgi:glycogen operon protein